MALIGITTSADANIGNGYTLLSIAGVILGGGEFVGGRVSPIGAVIGALTLALAASPLLTFMHIPPDWQVGANGAILIVVLAARVSDQPEGELTHGACPQSSCSSPGSGRFVGALLVWLAAITFTGGYGAGGMITAALSLAVFMVIVGVGQMFVITLGPGNVDLSLPANIGLASAVAMKVMDGSDIQDRARPCRRARLRRGDRRSQLPADLGAAHSADHRHAVGKLHHPVDRHQLWPRPADQAAARLCRFHQSADPGIPVLAIITVLFAVGAGDRAQPHDLRPLGAAPSARTCRAAWLAGIPVERIRFLTYTLSGTLGGLNGALLAGYFRGANVDIGNEYLLASIAVVVIGGTSVAGGKANVPGIWGAALFLVLLLTMLNTFGVSAGVRLGADRANHRRRDHCRGRAKSAAVTMR